METPVKNAEAVKRNNDTNNHHNEDKLCHTNITKDHIESILREHLKTECKLLNVNATIISKGLGFLSDVMRVRLKWDERKNDLPEKIVVKAPKIVLKPMDAPLDFTESNEYVIQLHAIECKAYKILCMDDKPPIPLASIYACWPVDSNGGRPGLIAMEDLNDRAGLVDVARGLNLSQWKNVVSTLADLHAWSLTTTINWRDELLPIESLNNIFQKYDEIDQTRLNQVKEKHPEYFADIDDELVLTGVHPDVMCKKYVSFRDVAQDVVNHGDTWVNNIMFLKNPDGSVGDEIAAIIDWQMCVKGPCVSEMGRLETCCLNTELRRNHYKEVLRFYYDRLKAKSCGKFTISFDQLEKFYEENFIYNAFLAIIWLLN